MITITQKIIIVFLLLLSIYSHSQCVVVNNSIPHQTSNNCNTFLADFIPHPNDPAVEVSLMIWVFNETNGTGLWSSNTVNNADAMIAKLNINYSSLQPPNFVVSGVANIQNSKISFSRKGFQKINNSSYFHDYDLAIAHYYDPSAINIYFIEDPIKGTSVDGPLPHNAVSYNTDILFQDIGNLPSGNLEHELGHALGLEHTWLLPQFYFNGGPYSNTNENCCPTLVPNDYHQEYLQNPSQPYVYLAGDEWGLFGNCNALGPLHSNNIMGYNAYCRNYLSPLQMALMHYNLRTNFTNVLTTNSYNNHLVRNPSLDYIVHNGTGGETWTTNRYLRATLPLKVVINLKFFVRWEWQRTPISL